MNDAVVFYVNEGTSLEDLQKVLDEYDDFHNTYETIHIVGLNDYEPTQWKHFEEACERIFRSIFCFLVVHSNCVNINLLASLIERGFITEVRTSRTKYGYELHRSYANFVKISGKPTVPTAAPTYGKDF